MEKGQELGKYYLTEKDFIREDEDEENEDEEGEENEADEEYDDGESAVYHLKKPIRILGFQMESAEDCQIELSGKYSLAEMLPTINAYLDWLYDCPTELIEYMREQTGEELPVDWEDKLEVFEAYFVFNAKDDYGATIAFGESLFPDHSIEIDLELKTIEDSRLLG